MKKFAVLCIAVLLVCQASGASLPVVGDVGDLGGLGGVIDKAVGLVGGLTDSIGKLPGDLMKLGGDDKAADSKGGLDLGGLIKGLPILG